MDSDASPSVGMQFVTIRHVAVDEIRIICVTRELRWAYGQPAALLMLLLACEASAREMTVLLCTIALSRPSPNYGLISDNC